MPATPPAAGHRSAPRERKRNLGAFYTPPEVVAHMVGMLSGVGPDSRVLEPSGGDGAFVCALLDRGMCDPQQVDVWDLDPATAPLMDDLGVSFTCCDSLLDAPDTGPYTHIVGNPPYLNKQSAYIKANRGRLRRAFSDIGVNDTYAMFTRLAVERLADGGQLVFLISDTFLTLGIHERLRVLLASDTRIDSITLLPRRTFPDASVSTAVLSLVKTPPPPEHQVVVRDLRECAVGDFSGGDTHTVAQSEFRTNVGNAFVFTDAQRTAHKLARALPALMDHLDGGLGMHTGDNAAFLAAVNYPDGSAPARAGVDAGDVDGQRWRFYHKRGGSGRWWGRAEHAVRWDEQSRAGYGIPSSALAGTGADGQEREGFLVSGIAARLSARTMTTGAMWESNKVFGLFPKNPGTHPVEFFLAVLNSDVYNEIARALNHTVSLQVRDIKALPMLPFTDYERANLARWGRRAVEAVREGGEPHPDDCARIERVVVRAKGRALRQMAAPASGAEQERRAKSNRAQADLFELTVLRDGADIATALWGLVEFAYTDELEQARRRIRAAHPDDALERQQQQEQAASALRPHLKALLASRAAQLGPVVSVTWKGLRVGVDEGVEDTCFGHASGTDTNISCKSTKSGPGTLRNLGGGELKKRFGIDVEQLRNDMYAQVAAAIVDQASPPRAAQLRALPFAKWKGVLTEPERALAKQVGRRTTAKLAAELCAAARECTQEQLRSFAEVLVGASSDPNLFVAVAHACEASITPAVVLPAGTLAIVPGAGGTDGGLSAMLTCDGEDLVRIQASCTNGVGLSALCIRSFHP